MKYSLAPVGNVMKIESGMLVNRDFRWAESEFSFEFLDSRDLIWGIRLLDRVFRPARRRELRRARTIVKTGPKTFTSGSKLPPDQLWRFWKFDRMLDVAFLQQRKGTGYKVLAGSWKERIFDTGLDAVEIEDGHKVKIKRNAWNKFSAKIVGGKLTYLLNGEAGSGSFQVDPRTNGRLGIFVHQGGPLYIRNLKFN